MPEFLLGLPHLADGPADRPMRALLQAMNNSDHLLIGEAEPTEQITLPTELVVRRTTGPVPTTD